MPPKKGKKGKKGEKIPKETDELKVINKQFYEITIQDLNNKLARYRAHNAKLEEKNEELSEKLPFLEEDCADIIAYLERKLAEKVDTIKEMDERLTELSKVRDRENQDALQKIKELELKYKAMHEQLTSEIRLLNGKLNSLEEFRIQKDELLAKFDEQETESKEQQRMHKETIYSMEKKIALDKNHLRKNVENELMKLSEAFTKSSEIRIASYQQRLIRENISLNNEMDKMIQTQHHMELDTRNMERKTSELYEKFASNETAKQRLIKTCQNQIKVIEKLTDQYEILKESYGRLKHYKRQYENTLKRDICERFTLHDMNKKLHIMGQRVQMVKSDKHKLIRIHQQHEAEIIRLRDILSNIKFVVQSNISNASDDKSYRDVQRKTLLEQLLEIITNYPENTTLVPSPSTVSYTRSIYRPGVVGLVPKSGASLLELFKREAKKIAAAELISPEFKHKLSDGKIIPRPRIADGPSLIDPEIGPSLIVSSIDNDDEIPEQDNLKEDTTEKLPSMIPTARKSVRPTGGTSIPTLPSTDLQTSDRKDEDDDEDAVQFFY